jgi:hypothetical protein
MRAAYESNKAKKPFRKVKSLVIFQYEKNKRQGEFFSLAGIVVLKILYLLDHEKYSDFKPA